MEVFLFNIQELYVKYEKSKLFNFLDLKFNALTEYIKNDTSDTYKVSSFDTRLTDCMQYVYFRGINRTLCILLRISESRAF